MRDELLLAAAAELDRHGEQLAGDVAQYALVRDLVELAARLRHVAGWLARPASTGSRSEAPPAPVPAPLVLTPREAAERLKLSTRSLARLEETGELRPLRRGRYVRYAAGQLDEYVARQTARKKTETTKTP